MKPAAAAQLAGFFFYASFLFPIGGNILFQPVRCTGRLAQR
jgi:hypothetical protein